MIYDEIREKQLKDELAKIDDALWNSIGCEDEYRHRRCEIWEELNQLKEQK